MRARLWAWTCRQETSCCGPEGGEGCTWIALAGLGSLRRELIFFLEGDVQAYGMARLLATNYAGRPKAELRARLRKGGLCHELVVPGGDWYRQVERFAIEAKADPVVRAI